MAWARRKRRIGGLLALFALAVQLALSFGHIHAEDFAPAQVTAPHDNTSTNNAGGDHDDCPICQSIFLLSIAAAPQPPVVVLVRSEGIVLPPRIEHAQTVVPPPAPFRARAPPQA